MLKKIKHGNIMSEHFTYMQRCFQLAELGNGFVAPNPMVGAVLVFKDRIIGEGFHQEFGKAHAEVNCIHSVNEEDKQFISKSTLYVSLEPCSHQGKTPPCADLIIKNKIPKVVISVEDSFHLVNGRGIQKLRDNNVTVNTGIMENEGKDLLKHFLYFHQYKKPFITLKFAQTKDGFIGIKNKEAAISNELSKRYVHQLRGQHQGILVGKNTVITDNPNLTVRHWNGKNPVRIILGSENDFPKDYHIFNKESETIFLSPTKIKKRTVHDIIEELFNRNIISVLIEGGENVLQQFIAANAWNEAVVITSDKILSSDHEIKNIIKAPAISGIQQDCFQLEDNNIQILKNPNALSNP